MKLTWMDKTVLWFDPYRGAKRIANRAMAQQVENTVRSFDGASSGRRFKNWRASSTSTNTENRPALSVLRNRARDLVRNEAYARGAVDAIVGNVIGAGIIAHAVAKTAGRAKNYDMLWLDWAESTDCDYHGRNNFYGIQALVMRHIFTDGEVLVRRVRRSSSFGLAVPIQLQVLEADHLDTYKENAKLKDDGFIVQGVEFDKFGRRRGYWLFETHPGEQGTMPNGTMVSKFFPADEVLHLFKVERAGQVRGITSFAPIMVRMKDYSDFSDATLLRQKLAACFTAFIRQVDPPIASTITDNGSTSLAIGEKLEPGIIEVLKDGQDITFSNPPATGDFVQFTREQLRAMARGIGVSYEVFTGDYSQVNFSSGRMGWIEFNRQIEVWRWHLIIPHLCIPSYRWFAEGASLKGYGTDPVVGRWTPPKREMIDPTKEVDAAAKSVRNGFKSLSEAIRENGSEPSEVFEQIAKDKAELEKLGIVLDSDPSKYTSSGAQFQPVEEESEDDMEDDKDESSEDKPDEEDRSRYFVDQEGSMFRVSKNGVEKIDRN
jgi:lambda family phage portal protein